MSRRRGGERPARAPAYGPTRAPVYGPARAAAHRNRCRAPRAETWLVASSTAPTALSRARRPGVVPRPGHIAPAGPTPRALSPTHGITLKENAR